MLTLALQVHYKTRNVTALSSCALRIRMTKRHKSQMPVHVITATYYSGWEAGLFRKVSADPAHKSALDVCSSSAAMLTS